MFKETVTSSVLYSPIEPIHRCHGDVFTRAPRLRFLSLKTLTCGLSANVTKIFKKKDERERGVLLTAHIK